MVKLTKKIDEVKKRNIRAFESRDVRKETIISFQKELEKYFNGKPTSKKLREFVKDWNDFYRLNKITEAEYLKTRGVE